MSKTDKIPSHVAIIMDGNGRWARARGLERHEGHRAGVNSLRNVIARAARNPGVRYLTPVSYTHLRPRAGYRLSPHC